VLVAVVQLVLTLPAADGPVRFGVPLPAAAVQRGLSVRGAGSVQWRPLPLRAADGLAWGELALAATEGTVRVATRRSRSRAPSPPTYTRRRELSGDSELVEWSWCDGQRDRRQRRRFTAADEVFDEWFGVGEALTRESPGLPERWLAVAQLPYEFWQRAGLLPPGRGGDRRMLEHLRSVARTLTELPGRRGAGDYARSGCIVTNLEYDMTLALLRLGLALADEELLRRARRSAWHLVDRDLDHQSGLPFTHGQDHRSAPPQVGHAWLQGLLWVGALTADEPLLEATAQIARALAENPANPGSGRELARDYGWPLLEMEAYLTMAEDPVVAAAAGRLARRIGARYDQDARTFRFGEGEVEHGSYFERGWITGGIVRPALRAHLRRQPDGALRQVVEDATRGLLDAVSAHGAGLATHWRCAGGRVFARHFAQRDPKLVLMLEGLPPRDRDRLLRRHSVQQALTETPDPGHPDLPTHFAMIARCRWIYRGPT